MEAILLTVGMAVVANKMKTEPPNQTISEQTARFGQPWRRSVYPDLGFNRFFHPQSNLMNTYSTHPLNAEKLQDVYIKHKLRTSANNTNQMTNARLHKSYHQRSIFEQRGHGVGVRAQHSKFGKHQTGQHAVMRYVHPRAIKPNTMNSHIDPYKAPSLENNTDFYDGELSSVTGKPEF